MHLWIPSNSVTDSAGPVPCTKSLQKSLLEVVVVVDFWWKALRGNIKPPSVFPVKVLTQNIVL